MKKIWIFFLVTSILSPLITLLISLKNKASLLWLFVATGLFFDLIISFTRRVLELNHYWLANLSALTDFIFVSIIFRKNVLKNKTVFYAVAGIVSVAFIISTLYNSIWQFNTKGISLFYFMYIAYSILGFYNLLQQQKVIFLGRSDVFWINTAFLVYGSGNFLLFLFTDYLKSTNNDLFRILWSTFFLIINIVFNILLALALSQNVPKSNDLK